MRLRTIARNNKGATIGVVLILVYALAAIAAPWLAPYDPGQNQLLMRLKGPSLAHWLGNDELGRDILSRVVWGARTSMAIAIGAVGMALVVAVPLGLAAGYFGRRVDAAISGVMEVLMAFPGILLALAIVAAFGIGPVKLMIAVGIYSVPTFARLVRASTLAARNQEYVQAARAIGQRTSLVIFRHILPNITGPVIVEATLRLGTVVLTAATLSFLGLGVQPPAAEWGAMIASSSPYMRIAPHATLFPGIALMLLVMACSLAGDGLRDVLDPTHKNTL